MTRRVWVLELTTPRQVPVWAGWLSDWMLGMWGQKSKHNLNKLIEKYDPGSINQSTSCWASEKPLTLSIGPLNAVRPTMKKSQCKFVVWYDFSDILGRWHLKVQPLVKRAGLMWSILSLCGRVALRSHLIGVKTEVTTVFGKVWPKVLDFFCWTTSFGKSTVK